MQEANAISFLPERQPRALTFITANAPTKKAGMYAGLPSFNDPVPWRPLAVLSHFFGCGSATVSVTGRVVVRIGFGSPPAVEIVTVAGDRAQRVRDAHKIVARIIGARGHESEGIGALGEVAGGVESISGGAASAGHARLPSRRIVAIRVS